MRKQLGHEGSILRDGLSVHIGGLLEENLYPLPPGFHHVKTQSHKVPSWKRIETLPRCWITDLAHEELSQVVLGNSP